MNEICVIIVNYCTPDLTIAALRSVSSERAERIGTCAIVIDNASQDGSAEIIEKAIRKEGWGTWARLIRSPSNGGFSSGNNLALRATAAEFYLLLNSDAQLRPGALGKLIESMRRHPDAGLIGPRLESEDGTPQESSFRNLTPITEFLYAARIGLISQLMRRWTIPIGIADDYLEAEWVSFACVMIRREVIEAIGLMDEGYFLYFEDIDYCRRARAAGFKIATDPSACAVHLRGGSASLKAAQSSRSRLPRYHFASRARYFAKFYGGPPGVVFANLAWLIGRFLSFIREMITGRTTHVAAYEEIDNWMFFCRPMKPFRPKETERI